MDPQKYCVARLTLLVVVWCICVCVGCGVVGWVFSSFSLIFGMKLNPLHINLSRLSLFTTNLHQNRKNDFAPSENFSCYAPLDILQPTHKTDTGTENIEGLLHIVRHTA